jgi:hypothetical protein
VTPPETTVEQAIFVLEGGNLYERGFSERLSEQREAALRLCVAFGAPPAGLKCPLAVFAQPFGADSVAVVQAGDLPGERLAFRLLVLPRLAYAQFLRDPFAVSDHFPPDWGATGLLPALTLTLEPPPRRSVAQLQKVLETGGSPTLLGAVQALVDGVRVVFERPAPAPQLVRDIWALLPDSAQAELWPASFAFANDLRFDLLIVPKADGLPLDSYIREEQAVDYPEGRYEFSLQYAIERGDQREVDRLLGRQSSKQMLRWLIYFVLFGLLAYLAINFMLNFL